MAHILIDAHYLRLGGGTKWNDWYLRVDRETLSSNHGLYGFQTPLATLHPFQGWADMFTTTPKEGVRDTYISLSGKVLDVSVSSEWHRFDADRQFASMGDTRADHYGSEFDLATAYDFTKQLGARWSMPISAKVIFTEHRPRRPAASGIPINAG
jgi:predicted heme/steroid binding protein